MKPEQDLIHQTDFFGALRQRNPASRRERLRRRVTQLMAQAGLKSGGSLSLDMVRESPHEAGPAISMEIESFDSSLSSMTPHIIFV